MTGSLSFARVEPVAEVDTCRGKSTAIKLRHPDTCHIRDFSGSLRLSAPLTHIRGEGSGGPSLPPSDVSKCFPCESQWQLSLFSRLAGIPIMLSVFRRGEKKPDHSSLRLQIATVINPFFVVRGLDGSLLNTSTAIVMRKNFEAFVTQNVKRLPTP